MKANQMSITCKARAVYRETHRQTRMEIRSLSGLSANALEDAATELDVDYEVFCAEYGGPDLADPFLGFKEMLRQWSAPWPEDYGGCLHTLALPQYCLAWAWSENDTARYCLDGEALRFKAGGWTKDSALRCGVVAATCAQKAIAHAKLLMAASEKIAA